MDTSPEYVNMCEKAGEIQDSHKPQGGDFYIAGWAGGKVEGLVILPMEAHIQDFCNYECLYLVWEDKEIWLPRPDQLQEMVDWLGNYNLVFAGYPKDIGMRVNKLSSYYDLRMASMEQLWLAFVMSERFNKIWLIGKEDWVKIPVEVKNAS